MAEADRRRWEEKYARGAHLGDAPEPLVLRFLLEPGAGARALDVACGCGRHAIELARRGYSVDAMDISPTALRIARQRAGALPIRFQEADLDEHVPETGAYAMIVSVDFSSKQLAPKLTAALAPGGRLLHVARPLARCSYAPAPGEIPGWYAGLRMLVHEEDDERILFLGERP